MQLNPYLSFNGQCEAALKFYEKCLGGKITMVMTYGGSPMAKDVPPDWSEKVIHARFQLDDKFLMAADSMPECYEKPQGFNVTLNIQSPEEAERVFNALAEKGTVRMPIQETFWAKRFGMLVDQFGTPWMINCEKVP